MYESNFAYAIRDNELRRDGRLISAVTDLDDDRPRLIERGLAPDNCVVATIDRRSKPLKLRRAKPGKVRATVAFEATRTR